MQINAAIEESYLAHPLFKMDEPCVDAVVSPISTMQMKKVVSTAASKTTMIEFALQIKDLGYTLLTIDTSINSLLNALMYNERLSLKEDLRQYISSLIMIKKESKMALNYQNLRDLLILFCLNSMEEKT